jgi:hypothetical protein
MSQDQIRKPRTKTRMEKLLRMKKKIKRKKKINKMMKSGRWQ